MVTIIACNAPHVLTTDPRIRLVASARAQVLRIRDFALQRHPRWRSFRRPFGNDLPMGAAGLESATVAAYAAPLRGIVSRRTDIATLLRVSLRKFQAGQAPDSAGVPYGSGRRSTGPCPAGSRDRA